MRAHFQLLAIGLMAFWGIHSVSSFAQLPLGQRDVPLIGTARSAFSKAKTIHSVRIDGSVRVYAGRSEEAGAIAMTASTSGANSLEISLDKGVLVTKQTEMKAGRVCTWSAADGKIRQTPQSNCWTATTWFLPHLSFQPSALDASAIVDVIDMGLDTDASGAYRKLRYQVTMATPKGSPVMNDLIHSWSTSDLRLDSGTLLPRQLDFVIHPDNNSNVNINVEVRFSDYRNVDDVQIPYRIQRYLNGSLQLDIEAKQVTIQ